MRKKEEERQTAEEETFIKLLTTYHELRFPIPETNQRGRERDHDEDDYDDDERERNRKNQRKGEPTQLLILKEEKRISFFILFYTLPYVLSALKKFHYKTCFQSNPKTVYMVTFIC